MMKAIKINYTDAFYDNFNGSFSSNDLTVSHKKWNKILSKMFHKIHKHRKMKLTMILETVDPLLTASAAEYITSER